MRCPECKTLNPAGAAACSSCGLILLNAQPKRRAEDFAGQKRRVSDAESVSCRFCSGPIQQSAVRCRHCGEVINEDYYRERAQRLRSRVNYASWVAYLFGLGALLVFRPVGLLSIAAGLLLSIAYYAIPVDPPPSAKQKRKTSLGTFIRKQMRLERVSIPIPALRNKKLVFVGTPLVAALIGYSANLFLLQEPMNDVLKTNSAFQGMEVSAHYQYWIVPGVIVYDLQSLSIKQTPIHVHTALVEFARKLKDRDFERVEISYQGKTKFSLDGRSFRKVADEYDKKNYDYVLYSFPRELRPENGSHPNEGMNGRDSLLQFHRQWYGEDALTKSVANGM